MEKLLLVGAGGLGRVVLEHANKQYCCFFIDDNIKKGTEVCGCTVIGSIEDLNNLYPSFKKLVVTIGDNKIRERLYKKAKAIGYEFPNIITSSTYISPYSTIGNGCIFLNNVVVQNGSTVGDGVILNPGVEIHHDSIIGNNVLIYTNSVIRTLAKVGDRAWIGSNLTVSNMVHVLEDACVENGRTLF